MYEYQATALANYSAYEQYFNDSSDSLYADNDPLETINYFKDALPTASLPCLTCITPLKMSMNP